MLTDVTHISGIEQLGHKTLVSCCFLFQGLWETRHEVLNNSN